MLKDCNSSAIVAVSDLNRARVFYEDTLGLTLVSEMSGDEVLTFRTGATRLGVYRSDYAGTNKANAVTWDMGGDLVDVVQTLQGKGVTFERYDFPGMEWKDGWHEAGGGKFAWFKDPDGNILHLVEGM